MNYFPTWGEMSEPVQLSLPGILEILSLKTCTETLNVCLIVRRHNLCWKTNPDGQSHLRLTRSKRWFSGVSTKVVSQCLCLHQINTEHTATKLLGQPQQHSCRGASCPCSRSSHSSCAEGNSSTHLLPTALSRVCRSKSGTELFRSTWTEWRGYTRLEKTTGHKPLYSKSSAVPGKWILCPPQHSAHCKVHVKFCQCRQRKQRKQEIREGEDR